MIAALTFSVSVANASTTPGGATTLSAARKTQLKALHKDIHRLQVLSVRRGLWLGKFVHHGSGGRSSSDIKYLRWIHNGWVKKARKFHKKIVKRAPVYHVLNCIHTHEGAWNAYNGAGPYYGGLQMSSTFQVHYGRRAVSRWGDARHWPVGMQMAVGYRAVQQVGFSPWSTSAAACGR
jgi:hypothetical protein